MDSSAPHESRGTIGGASIACGTRYGTRISGLQTRWARTRVTRPIVRVSIRSEGPTHHGLPRRQPLRSRDSHEPESG
jgi:hypothetical protein